MDYLKITPKGNYTVVEMIRPKVNALNFQMVEEIRRVFQQLETDDHIDGVILTGLSGIFSAGLDLVELYDYDKPKMRDFLIAFNALHQELVTFKKLFICSITGHSPAGGTVIAITADYRIMAEDEKFGIGLNEVAVNVQISTGLINSYSFWLGQQLAYQYILGGKLFNPNQALKGGLIDEIAPLDEVLPKAEKQMKKYLQADKTILMNTKAKLRKNWIDSFENIESKKELEQTLSVWWSPEVRAKMAMFINFLKNKSKT